MTKSRRWMFGHHFFGLNGHESYRELRLVVMLLLTV
jgi:hypothetical protein